MQLCVGKDKAKEKSPNKKSSSSCILQQKEGAGLAHGKLLPCAGETGKAGLCLPVGQVSSVQSKNKGAQERQEKGKSPGDMVRSSINLLGKVGQVVS